MSLAKKVVLSLACLFCSAWVFGATTAYFSPNGGCTKQIVSAINSATNSIHLSIYTFTSKPIAEALTNAIARNISVNVIIDGREGTNYLVSSVLNGSLPCLFDKKHTRMHDKYLIVDEKTVLTGSFNYTVTAENRNAENLLCIKGNKKIAAQFMSDWKAHAAHSKASSFSNNVSPRGFDIETSEVSSVDAE